MKDLQVNGFDIQVKDGLFSLNDLHRSAGSEYRYKPSEFFRKDSTKSLIEFLNAGNHAFKAVERKKGRYGGSWVCKELVYEYAMWLNPEFKVNVIRAFDALVNGSFTKAKAIASNDIATLDIINELEVLKSSNLPEGEKADKLVLLEKKWISLGSDSSRAMSMRRGKKIEFQQLQDEILNNIQIKFEF